MNRQTSILLLCFLLFMSVGCAGPSPTVEPPLRDADLYPGSVTQTGLTVAVDEISNPERVRQYFGVDLTRDGILPVMVVLANRSGDSFLVRPGDALLMEGNSVVDPLPVQTVEKANKRGIPANVVLQETVVPPQGKYQGVLFYRIEKTGNGLYGKVEKFFTRRLAMRVVVTNQNTGERLPFGPFALEGL
jgi:hypothetical protein